jgi:hypothetical protein
MPRKYIPEDRTLNREFKHLIYLWYLCIAQILYL